MTTKTEIVSCKHKNSSNIDELSPKAPTGTAEQILSAGKQLLSDITAAAKSCENIESLGALSKLLSFVFEKEMREELWGIGGATKRLLYQPAFRLALQYQSWVLDCMEMFHTLDMTNDPRVDLFVTLFQKPKAENSTSPSDLYQILTVFERQLRIVQSLIDDPPKSAVEEVKDVISRRRLMGSLFYIIASVALNIVVFPFVGPVIIGLIGIEVSVLFGLPSLLQLVTQRRIRGGD